MKRITTFLFPAFVIVLLSACGSNGAQPTPTPVSVAEPTATAIPAVEPTAESTDLPPAAETADLGALTANPWQWVSFTDPLQQFEMAGFMGAINSTAIYAINTSVIRIVDPEK